MQVIFFFPVLSDILCILVRAKLFQMIFLCLCCNLESNILKEDSRRQKRRKSINFLCSQENKEDSNNNMIVMLFLARNQIPTCFLKVGSVLHGLIITKEFVQTKVFKYHVFHLIFLSSGYMKYSFFCFNRCIDHPR